MKLTNTRTGLLSSVVASVLFAMSAGCSSKSKTDDDLPDFT